MGRSKKPKQDPPPSVREERPAAYFLSLSLENIRCFGKKQTLDLSDGQGKHAKWTVLLGENGTGKITVLQSLAAFWLTLFDDDENQRKSQLFSYLPS
jgi:predicted ATPase